MPEVSKHPAYEDGQIHSIVEERRRVLREIALRRGQVQFRRRLVRRYGEVCQVSRCRFLPLIEGAHILPYSRTGDNSVHNGLLLRSDLHTLFDLGFLAVHPETLKIALHPALLHAGYGSFSGAELFLNSTRGPNREGLKRRWDLFQHCLKENAP
jgi:putative restriction endonuclease